VAGDGAGPRAIATGEGTGEGAGVSTVLTLVWWLMAAAFLLLLVLLFFWPLLEDRRDRE
jgi:hypothetical protein